MYRSHQNGDRLEYRGRGPADAISSAQSITVRGQAHRRSASPYNRRDNYVPAPRSPDPWSARSQGYNSRSFSDVNEQPLGHGYNKCGYSNFKPRNRYMRDY